MEQQNNKDFPNLQGKNEMYRNVIKATKIKKINERKNVK